MGLTNLLSEHSSDLVELGNGSHFPYCGTQLYVIGRIIVASKFVGYLNIHKIKHTCIHGLILGGKTRMGDNLTTFSLTTRC